MSKFKKIFFVANARMPTEKAHGFQICKSCEQLSRQGFEVTLIVPERKNHVVGTIFDFYGVEKNFQFEVLKCFDFYKHGFDGPIWFHLNSMFFLIKLLLLGKIKKDDIIFTRQIETAGIFGIFGFTTFLDAHNWPEGKNKLFKFFLRKVRMAICNSAGTEKAFNDNGYLKTIAIPNGVDLSHFDKAKKQEDARAYFGLPLDKKIIMYVGHFYQWKGVDVVLEAAKKLISREDIIFVLAGGTEPDRIKYQLKIEEQGISNIKMIGHQLHSIVPDLLSAADLLLLPNIPINSESEKYTSPIKLFEYMASRRLIVASDMSSMRSVINDEMAVFFKPGDGVDLAGKISNIILNLDDQGTIKKIELAREAVSQYSWEKRAAKMASVFTFVE